MPGFAGGDNTDKKYAPHMWIGDYFVSESYKFDHLGKAYRCGETGDGIVVIEGDDLSPCDIKDPGLPKDLKEKAEEKAKGAFEKRQKFIKKMEKSFSKVK